MNWAMKLYARAALLSISRYSSPDELSMSTFAMVFSFRPLAHWLAPLGLLARCVASSRHHFLISNMRQTLLQTQPISSIAIINCEPTRACWLTMALQTRNYGENSVDRIESCSALFEIESSNQRTFHSSHLSPQ